MARYTHASIRRELMELRCQGLEGHRPESYEPVPNAADALLLGFRCSKCKDVIDVFIGGLELEVEEWHGR